MRPIVKAVGLISILAHDYLIVKNSYADHKGSGCTGGGADRIQSPSDVHKRPGAAHHGRQEISHQQGLVPQVSAWGDCVNK